MKNTLFGKDLVSVDSLNKTDIELIFETTARMEKLVKEKGGDDRLAGKIVTLAFFEPSTRTYSSFAAAAQRLGAGVVAHNGMQNTSIAKGESFEHTVFVFSRYSDCLIVRHPQPGNPREAAGFVDIPVINAGDGINEHPTQALFDTYTINRHFGKVNGLTIAMAGDLKNGRTVHSLTKTLIKMGRLNLIFVAPYALKMPADIKQLVKSNNSNLQEIENLELALKKCDVVYMTRVQKERFDDLSEYERLKDFYILNGKIARTLKKNSLIMHPLPIAAGEITHEIDRDPRSVYLTEQLSNG